MHVQIRAELSGRPVDQGDLVEMLIELAAGVQRRVDRGHFRLLLASRVGDADRCQLLFACVQLLGRRQHSPVDRLGSLAGAYRLAGIVLVARLLTEVAQLEFVQFRAH